MKSIVIAAMLALCFIWFFKKGNTSQQVTTSDAVSIEELSSRQLSSRAGLSSAVTRSVTELTEIIDQAIARSNVNRMREFDRIQLRSDLIAGWSLEEIEAVCRQWMITDGGEIFILRSRGSGLMWRREMWVDVLFRRWGERSPESALGFVAEFEDRALKQMETFDNTWAMGTPLSHAGTRFSAVMVGWSDREPREAYEALVSGDIMMSDPETFALFYPDAIGGVFENLSREDAAFALAEFHQSKDSWDRSKMLEGIASGIPLNHNFQELFAGLRDGILVGEASTKSQVRGKLFGRWLESNAKDAMSWYRSSDADWLMPVSRREALNTKEEGIPDAAALSKASEQRPFRFEDPLGVALRDWFLKSPVETTVWLQDNRSFVPVVVSGGSNFNFTHVDPRDLRKLLVETLHQGERERYLLSDVGESVMSDLVNGSTSEEDLNQIKELRLSEAAEEVLWQRYRKQNPDPFSTGGDPFAEEED